jgi:glycerol-3-phosphate dehydrogenase
MSFSYSDRTTIKNKLRTEKYDLLIIGGGITGAGIALDAASRGLKVALVEKNDFASGTSSRSTKLIHGGLRYLKQMEFALVKEVGRERAIVHKLAPHLVLAEKMLIPVAQKSRMGGLLISVGLKVYDWLANVQKIDRRRMLTKTETLRAEPLLKEENVRGGGLYAEYRTDDARLTIEIIKAAVRHGADCLNYIQVIDFTYQEKSVNGVIIKDVLTAAQFEIKSASVVSAAGPWVDELREINKSKKGKRLHLTKGVHVVVPREKLPVMQAIYFDAPDDRMIFAIPRDKITYIGTTDTTYTGDNNNVYTDKADVDYVLHAVNTAFKNTKLQTADVISSWAGLRPLIHEEGKSTSELSRKDEIFISDTGLISIAGGKLTGYRKMAERVVDLIIKRNFAERKIKICQTQRIILVEDAKTGKSDEKQLMRDIKEKLNTILGIDTYAFYLFHTYGPQAKKILDIASQSFRTDHPDRDLALAELTFCLQHEMVCTALDFFNRRTGMLYFYIERVKLTLEDVLKLMQMNLGWDGNRYEHEKQTVLLEIKRLSTFKVE